MARSPNLNNLSRRSFLKMTGVTLGAATLTCSGLGFLAARKPEIKAIETTCGGENPMKEKILVTYATRAGSTVEIAQAIGDVLCQNGLPVEVRPVKEVTTLDGYRGVVIGSAIRMGAWLPEAVQFVKTHKETLSEMPSAYFLASLFLSQGTPEIRKTVEAYLDPARAIHEPDAIALFAGKMDYSKLSWFDRQAAKFVKAKEGDHRDWSAIQGWAEALSQDSFGTA